MSAVDLYLAIAAIFAASAIPVIGECLIDAARPGGDNRLGALMWAALCLTLSALWPLLVAALAAVVMAALRDRIVRSVRPDSGVV